MLRYSRKQATHLGSIDLFASHFGASYYTSGLSSQRAGIRTLAAATCSNAKALATPISGISYLRIVSANSIRLPTQMQHRQYGKKMGPFKATDTAAKVVVPVPPLAESLSEGTVKQLMKRTPEAKHITDNKRLANMLSRMRRLLPLKPTRDLLFRL